MFLVKNDDEFTEDGEKLDLDECSDVWSARRCNRLQKKNRCDRSRVKQNCAETCGLCKGEWLLENSTINHTPYIEWTFVITLAYIVS